MERQALSRAMKNSISEVFETMFFLPLDFAQTDSGEEFFDQPKNDVLITKLDFKGKVSGSFVLYMPRSLARALTADFLGEAEEEVSEDLVVETAKEIINMIACHAKEGDGRAQVVETVFVHQADFATFNPLVMMGEKKLVQ